MSETSPPPGQAVEQQLAAALGLSLQHPAAQPSPSADNEAVLLETLTRSKTLEKEMCSVFSKYMDAVKASSTVDLNELVREKMERCKELEQQLGEVKHSLGVAETALQRLRDDHTELEKRRVSEVESVRCSMDDMFKDSLKEWEARIKHAEGERDKALDEANAAKQQAHEVAAKERGLCDKAERELEGVRLELSAMHEAMASLHGEMGAMQRELDSNGEREAGLRERADKAERVLGSVRAEREAVEEEKKRVETELSSLKQAARAAMLELASQRQKRDAEVASLSKEVEGLRVELSSAREQGSRASAANQDAARALEGVQEELDRERRENQGRDKELDEAQARGKEAEDARRQLTEALSASESRCAELEGRAHRALEDARTLRTQLDGARTQQRAMQQEVQRLETEKHDLIFDGQQRLEQGMAVQDELDALRSKLDKVIDSQKALEAERDAMAQREREAKLKVEEASLEVKEMRGSLSEAERERDEALQQKREVGESAKAGQRESAARIVEFSQKNARLLADVTQLRGSLSEAEQERDELRAAAATTEKDAKGAKEQAKQLWDKIQGLEEELEEVRMKKEAVDAQLSGLREAEIRERQDWEGQHRKAQDLHRREMEELRKTLTEDAERRVAKAEAMRQEAERMCERSLVKTRDGMKRQLEEVNGARQREVTEARSKAAALGSALDDLNRELREEEKKNAGLRDEIAQLHRLLGSHAQFSNGEVKPYGDLCKENDGLRREVMHLRGSHEAASADFHRQLTSANQARQQHEQALEEQRERGRLLERDSQSLQQTLSKSERETQSLRMSLQQAQQQVSALQRSVTDADARVDEAVRGKDQEIERLTRRNRVLQDAISRISHETSTEHSAPQAYPPPQIDPPSPFPSTQHGHSSSSGSLLIPGSETQAHRYTPHPPHGSPPPLLSHNASFLASPGPPSTNTHHNQQQSQSSSGVLYGADAWMAAGVAVGSGYHERPPTIPTRPNNVGPMVRHAAGTQAYDARRPPEGYGQERGAGSRRGEGMGPDSLDESLQAHGAGTHRRRSSSGRGQEESAGGEEEDDGYGQAEGTVGLESRESNGDLAASIGASNGRRFQEAALRILASAESTLKQPMLVEPQEADDWEDESQAEEEEEEEESDDEEERRGSSSGSAVLSGRRPRAFSAVAPPQPPKPRASKVVKRAPQGQKTVNGRRRAQGSDGGVSKAYGGAAVSGAGRVKPSVAGERQARRVYR